MKAKSILASIVVVLFAVGCGSGDDTNGTGTADSGNEMQLTFDGDSCVYEGATELAAGPTTLTFINASEEFAFFEMLSIPGDETAQDLIDYEFADGEPSSKFHPSWTEGVAYKSNNGGTFVWEGELEPAIHSVVCGVTKAEQGVPTLYVWLGSVFTVTG
jgi:hypothetical protein